MATTTRTGAIYGIGVYGVDLYGVSNVSILVDGVQGTCTTDSGVVIEADANHVVIGVTSAGAVGQVGTIGKAVVLPTGIEATGNIGTTSLVGDALVVPTGVQSTGAIGTVTVLASAVTVLNVSVEGVAQVGTASVIAKAVVAVTSNQVTGAIGSVNVFENELQVPVGVAATLVLGTPVVVNLSFDYDAVKDQYDRRRTIYIGPRSSSATRTIYVPATNRVVYIIGTRSTSATRTKLAA